MSEREIVCRCEEVTREEIMQAIRQGAKRLALGAQLYAIPFYQKSGYLPSGEQYLDEFCMHEMLYKTV